MVFENCCKKLKRVSFRCPLFKLYQLATTQTAVFPNAENVLVRVTFAGLKTRKNHTAVEKEERLNMPKMDVMAMSEQKSIMNV